MDESFGEENFRNEIIVNRGASKAGLFTQFECINSIAVSYDNLYWYSKNENLRFRPFVKDATKEQKTEGKWTGFDKGEAYDRPTMRYEILGVSIDKGQWKWSKERAYQAVENYKKYLDKFADKYTLEEYWEIIGKKLEFIRKNDNGKIQYWVEPRDFVYVDNNWLDITGYSSSTGFQTENSEHLLKRIIETLTEKNDLVMDFFLGSGTTMAVAHKLGRKWIGIEMGEHFYTVILPRMKKVLSYDKSGISKYKDIKETYSQTKAGGFFKYFDLEQYEDSLNNIEIDKSINAKYLHSLKDYYIRYMLDYETSNSNIFLNVQLLENPFEYKLKVINNGEEYNVNLDLIETFNYLYNVHVNKVEKLNFSDKDYLFIFGTKDDENILIVWRSLIDINYENDRDFICEVIRKNNIVVNTVFTNGNNIISNKDGKIMNGGKSLDPILHELILGD